MSFFTIGHSTRSAEELAGLLQASDVAHLADVRAVPRSRTNPQFDAHALSPILTEHGISYQHVPELGGLRRRSHTIAPEVNGFWRNRSFHNYADHALTGEFAAGFQRLLGLGRTGACAIMCAEAVWWRCHRRIIADHLIHHGEIVFHILGAGKVQPAGLTPGASTDARGRLIYPLR